MTPQAAHITRSMQRVIDALRDGKQPGDKGWPKYASKSLQALERRGVVVWSTTKQKWTL